MQPSPRPTAGLIAVTLLAFTLVACTASPLGASPTQAAPSPTPDASADPPDSPSPQPLDPNAPHPAAGLGFIGYPDADSPVSQIFVVTRNGELRQVTGEENAAGAGGLVWAPNGRRIAFAPASVGTGAFPSVYVVNADGSRLRKIDQLDVEEFTWPYEWSADSKTLLYHDTTTAGDQRIWLADVASGNVRQIGSGAGPRWLPDGERITFSRGVAGLVAGYPEALTPFVFVMDVASGRVREFAEATRAVWSPDGSKVLIEESFEEGFGARLLIADADGSNRRDFVLGGAPVWSPDGTRVAYTTPGHDESGQPFLAVVDVDGREVWSGVVGQAPVWSPDGSRLAVEIRHPDLQVVVLDAQTGELLWQTAGTGPSWRP